MIRSFRDARRIQPQRDITVTGHRLAVFLFVQGVAVVGAFAGGYFARSDAPASAVSTRVGDPLGRLDAQDPPLDLHFHDVLTGPVRPPALSTAAASPMLAEKSIARASRQATPTKASAGAQSASAKAPPRSALLARAVATRAVRVPDGSRETANWPREGPEKTNWPREGPEKTQADSVVSDDGEVRALDARVRQLAERSARNRARPAAAARAGSTDDELIEAIGEVRR